MKWLSLHSIQYLKLEDGHELPRGLIKLRIEILEVWVDSECTSHKLRLVLMLLVHKPVNILSSMDLSAKHCVKCG